MSKLIYKINDNTLNLIKINDFKYESELQHLIEKNLNSLFRLQFLKSEFTIGKFRLDTIAFDNETNSFVIIEYKKTKNESLIDQGSTYLEICLDRKSDLVLLYNEINNSSKGKKDFDWEGTKVYFISPEFGKFQKLVNLNKFPFKLFEINKYLDDILLVNEITNDNYSNNNDDNKINEIEINNKENNERKKYIKLPIYTEEYLLKYKSPEINEIYDLLKKKIFEELDNVEIKPKKFYISYTVNNEIFVDFEIQKNSIKMYFKMDYQEFSNFDPYHKLRDVTNIGHLGNGNCSLTLNDIKDINYAFELISKSYEDKK